MVGGGKECIFHVIVHRSKVTAQLSNPTSEVRSYTGNVDQCVDWMDPQRTPRTHRRPRPEPDRRPAEPRAHCGGTTCRTQYKTVQRSTAEYYWVHVCV